MDAQEIIRQFKDWLKREKRIDLNLDSLEEEKKVTKVGAIHESPLGKNQVFSHILRNFYKINTQLRYNAMLRYNSEYEIK